MGFLDRLFSRQSSGGKQEAPALPSDRILRYKIKGTNPGTRRRNTRQVVCGSWEPLSEVEARTGLLPPFEHVLDMPEVTEAQLELMKKKGVPFIAGMFRADASALIQHALDGVQLVPDRGLPQPVLQFFVDEGIVISSWMTLSDLDDGWVDGRPALRRLLKNYK